MNPTDSSDRFWLAVLTFVAGLFCAVLVGIPVAEHRGLIAASWVRFGLSPACHQITDRCLDLGAGPLPVCARCAGLYAGGLVGLLVTLVSGRRFQPPLRWLVVAATPSIIDFILGFTNLPTLANWPRFVAALFPGLVAGLMLADAVCRMAAPNWSAPAEDHVE